MPPPPAAPGAPSHILGYAAVANRRFAEGDLAGSVEAAAVAAVIDIQQHRAAFLGGADAVVQLCGLYTRAYRAAFAGLAALPPIAARPRPSVLITTQCIASGQASSALVLRLARELGAAGHRVGVLVADELTERQPALKLFRCPEGRSSVVGAALLAQIAEHAEILTIPTSGGFIDGARAGVKLARAWAPDLAVLVASPACPIQAGLAVARIAPVQVNLSVGVPMLMEGIDHVIYNNPRTLAGHAQVLAARGYPASTVATSGGDARPGVDATPIDRANLGIPADALLLVSAANCLPRRMLGGTCAADLAAFLTAHPGAHWLGVGRGDFTEVLRTLGPASGRAHLAGSATDIRPWVKAGDIFLNEYPEGGGNSVIEAMGCGVPVVAMNAGPQHGCCIGAELVGEDAIPAMDVAAYWSLASRWMLDPAARAAAGVRQQRRALDVLDFGPIMAEYRRRLECLLTPAYPAAA